MPDINDSIALGVQPTKAPDVIGQISSLAQLQYLAAQTGVAQANAAFLGQKVQSLRDYGSAVAAGTDPIDALQSSNLAATDAPGANAILGNIQTARALKASAAYATSGDPNSLAIMGPGVVQQGMTTQANQQFAATGDPNALRGAGAEGYSTAMNAIKTGGETAIQRATIMGQIGNGVVSGIGADGSIPPEIRQNALQQAIKAGLITPQQAQQESQLSDGQFATIAKSWQAAGMASKDYAEVSGGAAAAQAAATANYKPIVTEPQQGVFLPPGLANIARPGGAPAPFGAAPGLSSAAPAAPGGPNALPIMAQSGAPTAMPALPAAIVNPSSGPNARPVQPLAAPVAANSFAPTAALSAAPAANGPNYYGVVSAHESGNVPGIVNPNGGAAGLYQFMPGTWRTLMQQHPELGLTANGATDPAQAAKAMQASTADNAKALAGSGVAVNDKNLFMAHFLGAGGAAKFIQAGAADPNADAAALFPAEAKQNPTIFYAGSQPRTLSQVYAVMTRNFGNGLTANGATPSEGAVMAQGAPLAQPGGSVPGGFIQPGAPGTLEQATALSFPANLKGNNPLAPIPAQNGVAPIVPSPPAPLPGAPTSPPGAPPVIPTAATAATAASGVTAAPTGLAADSTTPLAAPQGWSTMQPAMTLAQKAAQEATGRGVAEAQVKQFGEAKEAYQTASTAQMKLGELQHSLDQLPTGASLLTPGSGATERLGLAKYVNTLLTGVGASPAFDPNQISAAENAQKINGGLGFDMSRTLGAREAAQIVQQAISLNPGIQNTPQGARTVAAAINAGLQRQKDFYSFLSANGNAPDADLAFNRANPPSKYVQEARALAAIPQAAIEFLQKNPKLTSQFDAKYGPDLSRYYTGQ